jgi:hypothetical protein|eukprot:Anaeramoba_flamelloidesa844473_7.p1 GENE.a844473_7~~a844473_7.p1  ORF type:complete len:118 (+),score=11.67 a844473_7:12-365(+)
MLDSVKFEGKGYVKEITEDLIAGMRNSTRDYFVTKHAYGEQKSSMIVFQKYYLRASADSTLSVLVCKDENELVTIEAVVSGQGQGYLHVDSGSHSEFIKRFEEVVLSMGFRKERMIY